MKKSVLEIFLKEDFNENELEEALPGDLAKAYDNSGLNLTYRSRSDTPDFNAADYTEVSPAQAVEILKSNPMSLVAIVKDRLGRSRAVKFGSDGRTINTDAFRFEVADEYAYANKRGKSKGELRRDIHYIPAVHVVSVADKVYVTNENSVSKDQNKRAERAKNPESRATSKNLMQKFTGASNYATSASRALERLKELTDSDIKSAAQMHGSTIDPEITYNDGFVENPHSYCVNGYIDQQLAQFKLNFAKWGWYDYDTRNSWASYLLALQNGNRTYRTPTVSELKKLYDVDDSKIKARIRYYDAEKALRGPIEKAKEAINDAQDLERKVKNVEVKRDDYASPEKRAGREANITYYIEQSKRRLLLVLAELENYETQLDDLDAADMAKIKEYDDTINDLQNKLAAARASLPQNLARGSIYANTPFGNKVPESLELEEGKSIGEIADDELGIEHEDPLEEKKSLNEDYNGERTKALANYLDIDVNDIEEVFDNDFDTPEGEYLVLNGHEAEERAKEEVKNSFDDMGLNAFTQEFRNWIVNNAIADSVIDNFIDQEIDYFETQEEDEETLNMLKSLNTREEKVQYITDVFGDLDNFVKPENIDLELVAEEAISRDGIGHFIAYYDGDEIELSNDLFAYRIN